MEKWDKNQNEDEQSQSQSQRIWLYQLVIFQRHELHIIAWSAQLCVSYVQHAMW